MNLFDISIIFFVVASAILGGWRGFTREFLGVTSWVMSILAALFFGGAPFDLVKRFISSDQIAIIVSYGVVFFVSLVFFTAITYLLTKLVKSSFIRGIDRLLGFGYGIIRGGLVAIVGLVLIEKVVIRLLKDSAPELIRESYFMPKASEVLGRIIGYIPADKIEKSREFIENLGEGLPHTLSGDAQADRIDEEEEEENAEKNSKKK